MNRKFLQITNSVGSLTLAEQKVILSANFFMYSYGLALIALANDKFEIHWSCDNLKEAKEYLQKNKIKEIIP